jgi:hypothetical protein
MIGNYPVSVEYYTELLTIRMLAGEISEADRKEGLAAISRYTRAGIQAMEQLERELDDRIEKLKDKRSALLDERARQSGNSPNGDGSCTPAAILGATWTEEENGWTGTWTPGRQISEDTREFSASWTKPGEPKTHRSTLKITIKGANITIERQDPPDYGGAHCTYSGTINGKTASGSGGCGNWKARIGC